MSKHKYLRVTAYRETLHRLPANWDEMRTIDRFEHIKSQTEEMEDFFRDWTVCNDSMHAAIPLWEICEKPEVMLTLDGTYSKKDELTEDTSGDLFVDE